MGLKTVPPQYPDKIPALLSFVGEAPGELEVASGVPFVGKAGGIHNMTLRQAGIDRARTSTHNTLDFKLKGNKIESITVTRLEAVKAYKEGQNEDPYADDWLPWIKSPVVTGGYLHPDVAIPQLIRLREELKFAEANCVVALGGLAIWALLGIPGVGTVKKMQGTVHESALVPGLKVIPSYHPAAVIYSYGLRPLLWATYLKAMRESSFPELRPMKMDIIVPHDLNTINNYFAWWEYERPLVAVDIETYRRCMIDCIGFGHRSTGMCIPFFDINTLKNYWPAEIEVIVREMIVNVLRNPNLPKLFQNGSYDVQWLWEKWGVKVKGWTDDTRLLHHALWPEMPKDLATMAALHTEMPAWKPLKGRVQKRDE